MRESRAKVFIRKALEVHKLKYTYEKVAYVDSQTKVTITCPIHGDFDQEPASHVRGRGCPICCKNSAVSQEEFLSRCFAAHGDTYDYSSSVYVSSSEKVRFTCRTHGEFLQYPSSHWIGKGCDKCSDKRNGDRCRGSKEDFILDAENVHGMFYDYSLVDYKDTHTKVRIVCPVHGKFLQSPHQHKVGQKCPSCAKSGYKDSQSGWLYVLKCDNLTKIGITNRKVQTRANDINKSSGKRFEIIFSALFADGSVPNKAETVLLRELRSLYSNVDEKFDGSTETFVEVSYEWLISRIIRIVADFLPAYQN